MLRSSISCAALVTLLLTSSAQSDSLRRAKEAIDKKDFISAALIYSDKIDSLGKDDNETLNKLRLNAGSGLFGSQIIQQGRRIP